MHQIEHQNGYKYARITSKKCEGPGEQSLRTWLEGFRQAYSKAKDMRLVYRETGLEDFATAIATFDQAWAYHASMSQRPSMDYKIILTAKQLKKFGNKANWANELTFAARTPELKFDAKDQKLSRSCLYNEQHQFEQCKYLVAGLAPHSFKENQNVRQTINKKLRNPRLCKKVELTLKKAGQRLIRPVNSDKGITRWNEDEYEASNSITRSSLAANAQTTQQQRALKDDFIYDPGSTCHVLNNT